MSLPKSEKSFMWKELVQFAGDKEPRLVTPWTPDEYEYPMDYIFPTAEAAVKLKQEIAEQEDWYLVEVTLTPVAHYPPTS